MILGKMRSFFKDVLSRESLSSSTKGPLEKHGPFLPELLHMEKLPECPPAKKSGKGFLFNLLAFEKLPAAKIRQPSVRNFVSGTMTSHLKKNHAGSNHNE
jgi:hypothetical protein